MTDSVFQRHSLKIRITLTTLVLFFLSIWSLSYYASHALRLDMERLLGEQQFSTVSLLATQVNREVDDRLKVLENLAEGIHPVMMSSAPSVQTFLEQHPYSHLFNDGVMAYGLDGTAIATAPLAKERIGLNYLDRDYLVGALKDGKATIGRPIIGRTLRTPIFLIAVPVRDYQGQVIGALAGITNLGKPNFLDELTDNSHGNAGGYLLVATKQQLIVTATDKSRVMGESPTQAVNPLIERLYRGREGAVVYTDPRGVEVLASVKHIPLAGWHLEANLPTSEAFSPIRAMQKRLLLATILLTVVIGGLGWWLLKRQLSPLLATLERLGQMSVADEPAEALPIAKNDEIGQLIGGFNRFLAMLKIREEARKESENQLRELFDEVPIGYHEFDAEGRITRVNKTELESLGYSLEEMLGHYTWEYVEDSIYSKKAVLAKLAGASSPGINFERNFVRKDGTLIPMLIDDKLLRDKAGNITGIRSVVMDITLRKSTEEEIKHLAFYDQLTGLPNRRLLFNRLEQSLASRSRHKREGALLFLDLDSFKTLNDTLGHDTGDLLLQQVAKRLTGCVREGDTVARIGGDEFVVMLEDLSEDVQEAATQVEVVGEKILANLSAPYLLGSYTHRSTASLGITLFADDQDAVDDLLKRADLAMYQAKAAGRNTLRFFDPKMQAVVNTRAALEAGLREALRQEQFLVYYQPQVDSSGRVFGAEALLRWQHPERGLVSPGEFIPLAEDTGLIFPIGQWVLETVCSQLAAWAAHPATAQLSVAVNVSVRQLHQASFVDQVLAVLERSKVNPQRLKLELTESLLADDAEGIIAKMTLLKTKGVGFSLDDFGTGYSSLSYLKRMPLDQLKIDQSFVRDIYSDPNDAAIAKMIIVLAGSLGLKIIAEGVETEEQREFLLSNGCPTYQGYLFSHPLPLDDFLKFVMRANA
ncbi:MAG: diguanylate cyclase/phosphodiesterase with sensor(s) [Proteobacteria bacterium]|nr:diguanylate cyclase/phosphodiesterase with sensor(s) [Pseudomonadota bacterium]